MRSPAIHSGATVTWAPAGIAYADGKLYFAGLRGQALYEVSIESGGKLGAPGARFKNEYGRLRAARLGPDGSLYISTSNKDGRGDPREGDDKIIKLRLPLDAL